MAQQIVVASQAPAISEALCSLFMAAMEFYSTHSEVAIPEIVRTTLLAMHQAAHDPAKPQTAMLILGVSVIAEKSGVLSSDLNVQAALALARQVLMACGA